MCGLAQAIVTGAAAYFTGGLSTALGTTLSVSAAMQAVGVVTKNEDLQKLGTIVGIGAGIGGATGLISAEVGSGVLGTGVTAGAGSATGYDLHEADYGDVYNRVADTVTGGAVAPNNTGAPALTPDVAAKATSTNIANAATPPSAPPIPPPGGTPPPGGILNSIIKDPAKMYGAGLIAQGAGPVLAGAFGPDQGKIAADKLALEQQRLDAQQAELDRRNKNFNNIPGVRLPLSPNRTVTPFPNRPTGPFPYASPGTKRYT